MSAEQSKQVVNNVIEAFNARNYPALSANVVSPNLTYVQNGNSGGREKWTQDFRNCAVTFPDVHLTVKSQLVEDDHVITELVISGTHLAPLGEIPATGRSMMVDIHLECLVKDGIMLDWVEQVDEMSMARQLGLIPDDVAETISTR